MSLKDMFSKKYPSNCWCNNCETFQEVQIPKGVSITQFIEGSSGKCNNCGCSTLVAGYKQIDEFKQVPKKQPSNQPMQRAQIPQPRPSNRPANSVPPQRPRPVEPDFSIAPDRGVFRNTAEDVDFWEGTKKANERADERERRRQ